MATDDLLGVWFVRHGEIPSHRGDLPVTPAGLEAAERTGHELAATCPTGTAVEFLHAPTLRTAQTVDAIRRGFAAELGDGAVLDAPRVEHAIRNPDLFVAGHRVEMVSSADALVAQLPDGVLSAAQAEQVPFFTGFWSVHDRIGHWLDHDDPPGERAEDVARRFFSFVRSLRDLPAETPRRYVLATHSGPLRALLRRYVLDDDPGEPEYVEAIELRLAADGAATWSFRDTTVERPAGS